MTKLSFQKFLIITGILFAGFSVAFGDVCSNTFWGRFFGKCDQPTSVIIQCYKGRTLLAIITGPGAAKICENLKQECVPNATCGDEVCRSGTVCRSCQPFPGHITYACLAPETAFNCA